MTNILRHVKTFKGSTNDEVTDEINNWIQETHVTPMSMTVSSVGETLFAFVIYEMAPEKQRSLGLR